MLNLYEIRVFLIAAETENFSEAGRRLNISQPAVSMQIRALEDSLGVELFHRAGRHISLSEAGHALVPMARDLISRAIQIEETMASMQGEVLGLLKLACSTTSGKYVLPRLLARLCERYPHIQVACAVSTRDVALQTLMDGEAHIAITSLREPYREVEYRPFLTDRIVLVVPPHHPWAGVGEIQPAELRDATFIMREEGSGTNEALRDALAAHDVSLSDLNMMMVLGNSEAIRMAVQEGIGAAFVSGLVASEGIRSGALAPVQVAGVDIQQTLYLARHTGRPATSAQTAFWEFALAGENSALRALTNQPVPVPGQA